MYFMPCKLNNLFRHLGFILLLFSLASICVIKLTEWRFNVSINKHCEINEIIVNISYSYIAAFIFHLVVNEFPKKQRENIMRRKVNAYMKIIRSSIRNCIMSINAFRLDDKISVPTKEEFVKSFSEMKLTQNSFYITSINRIRSEIKLKVEQILVIQDCLSDKELDVLLSINDSLFLTEDIRPTEYINAGDCEHEIPGSNQKEIGKSIYRINELINSIVK